MAKKKAFVRYAANKAVPGSLIVRTKAPKVGIWKEVPADLCCGGENCTYSLSDITICTNHENAGSNPSGISLTDKNGTNKKFDFRGWIEYTGAPTDYDEFVKNLNTNFPYLGKFTVVGNQICLQLSSFGAVGYAISSGSSQPSDWDLSFIVP